MQYISTDGLLTWRINFSWSREIVLLWVISLFTLWETVFSPLPEIVGNRPCTEFWFFETVTGTLARPALSLIVTLACLTLLSMVMPEVINSSATLASDEQAFNICWHVWLHTMPMLQACLQSNSRTGEPVHIGMSSGSVYKPPTSPRTQRLNASVDGVSQFAFTKCIEMNAISASVILFDTSV